MKKIVLLLALLSLASFSQAQIGSAIGKKLKEKASQTINNALGNNQNQNQNQKDETPITSPSDNDEEITPQKVIEMVPTMPQPNQLAEYLCESHRANPRTLKMLANPTTTYLAQLAAAGAGSYATLASQNGYGRYFAFDEQLLKEFGITQEQYDAMSEEQQQELALKYAAEMEDRYYKTIERLASDEKYQKMIEQYNNIEDQINKIYNDADSVCRDSWQNKFGSKPNPTEDDMCNYYRQNIQTYYNAILKGMRIRKTEQMTVAKQIDTYVQSLAKLYPNEIYSGLYSQQSVCATSYVADASRVTTMSDPR